MKLTLIITILATLFPVALAEEIVKRNLAVEASKYQTPQNAVLNGVIVSLELKPANKGIIGSLTIANTRRSAEITIKGAIKDNVLHFTFTDATSGASGSGVVFGNTPQTLQLKFTGFNNLGDGSTAMLLGTHLIEKQKEILPETETEK